MAIDIDEIAFQIHNNAVEKGFWEPNNGTIFYLKQIAMIHSEASEALEAIRKEHGDEKVVEELVDILIRTLDLWAGLVRDEYTNVSIEDVLMKKIGINNDRPRLHGVLA